MKEWIMETSDTGIVKKVKQELIRCKDCKWWKENDDSPSWHPCIDMKTDRNWFCADGEWKD